MRAMAHIDSDWADFFEEICILMEVSELSEGLEDYARHLFQRGFPACVVANLIMLFRSVENEETETESTATAG